MLANDYCGAPIFSLQLPMLDTCIHFSFVQCFLSKADVKLPGSSTKQMANASCLSSCVQLKQRGVSQSCALCLGEGGGDLFFKVGKVF